VFIRIVNPVIKRNEEANISGVLTPPSHQEVQELENSSEFSEAATQLLLTLYLSDRSKFRNPTIKKNSLWKELTTKLNQHGYNFTDHSVERKFRNLKSHFLKIKDNNTKTGRGRKSWQYFDVMEEIFERDRCVNPTSCISSIVRKKILFF
jgi:hypothetical protein